MPEKKQPPVKYYFLAFMLLLLYLDKQIFINFLGTVYKSLIPLFYSIVIVYLLTPIIKFVQRNLKKYTPFISDKIIKVLSVVIAYMTFCIFGYFLIISIVPILRDNIANLVDHFPMIVDTTIHNIERFCYYFHLEVINDYEALMYEYVDTYVSIDTIKNALPYLYNTSTYILNFIYNIAVAFIISLYLVFEVDSVIYNIKKIYRAIFGQRRYNISRLIVSDSIDMFNVYMLSKIKDSMIVGIILFICMKIFGINYAVLLSTCVTITNMIPYIGPFIGGFLGVILLLSVDLEQAIIFGIIIIILQQLDCWLIGVIVLEKDTKMSPLLILMSVIVAGALFGWIGMLIGTPIAQIIQYISKLVIQAEEMKYNYKEEDL